MGEVFTVLCCAVCVHCWCWDVQELMEILPVLMEVDKVDDVRLHLGPLLAKLYENAMNGHGFAGR